MSSTTVWKCDGCGGEGLSDQDMTQVSIQKVSPADFKDYDLCSGCIGNVRLALSALRKQDSLIRTQR